MRTPSHLQRLGPCEEVMIANTAVDKIAVLGVGDRVQRRARSSAPFVRRRPPRTVTRTHDQKNWVQLDGCPIWVAAARLEKVTY